MDTTAKDKFALIISSARKYNASDIHLIAGLPPAYRVSGEIIMSDWTPLTREEMCKFANHILNEKQQKVLEEKREICFSHFHEEQGRTRVSFYHRLDIPEMAIRMGNLEIESHEDLMLPDIVNDLALKTSGLIIVTGPTGVGKTTTLNYMIDLINATRRCKVIMIEDPVEFEHSNRKSIVVQIEVGTDTNSFSGCLRHVLRLDPDVICVGEMRDLETISTALTAAETGHLVIATLHTPSAYGTIERIVSSFNSSQQPQVIMQLSSILEGVIAQRLIPTVDKKKRVLATEVLLPTKAIKHIIREGDLHKLRNAMFSGRQTGMHTIEDSLKNLYQRGLITFDNAINYANESEEIKRSLKNTG